MKIINLFVGPSGGKTISGKVLSGMLSMSGYKAEYIPEFAKFATWAGHTSSLSDQIYMFGKQHNRLHIMSNWGLDYVVMDGPLLNAIIYAPDDYFKNYSPLVFEVFNSFDNVNYVLERNKHYNYEFEGRNEDLQQALQIDKKIEKLLQDNLIDFKRFPVTKKTPYQLFKDITGRDFSFEE